MRFGSLYAASLRRAAAINSAVSVGSPSSRTMKAVTASDHTGSGVPTTATSRTPGTLERTPSTSTEETFNPPDLMTSF